MWGEGDFEQERPTSLSQISAGRLTGSAKGLQNLFPSPEEEAGGNMEPNIQESA